jgi:hypothetical protein
MQIAVEVTVLMGLKPFYTEARRFLSSAISFQFTSLRVAMRCILILSDKLLFSHPNVAKRDIISYRIYFILTLI